jgi:pimeloyl-ACP methyl ester carboxylesterase
MSEPWRVLGGERSRRAVIFGPVTPSWDGGEFCAPLTQLLLERGYGVAIVDTPALIEGDGDRTPAPAWLDSVAGRLVELASGACLLAGYALGGTLALKFSRHFPNTERVLCLSGPGFVDATLQSHLARLIEELRARRLGQALSCLAALVAPAGSAPEARHRDTVSVESDAEIEPACRRMLRGFELLAKLDSREEVAAFGGEVLCMIGELSQLATADNQAIVPGRRQRLMTVPGAGMRLLKDNPRFALDAIGSFIET